MVAAVVLSMRGPFRPRVALHAVLAAALLASACSATRGAHPDRAVGTARDDRAPEAGRGAPPTAKAEPPIESASARPPEIHPPAPPAALDDDGPLVAKIDRTTPPRRAAALRLTEQGRAHLAAGEPARAIEVLERAVAIDARSPYAYYFLAQAHAEARHPALARSFVARAEQLFAGNHYWLGRAHALHGRLAEDGGRSDEARREYGHALAAWPQNADAATGLARLDGSGQGAR